MEYEFVRRDPLEPTRLIQRDALVAALTDILMRAGNGQATLCLPNKNMTYLAESGAFNQDGVTEKVTFNIDLAIKSSVDSSRYRFAVATDYVHQMG